METITQLHTVVGDVAFRYTKSENLDFQFFKHLNRIDGTLTFEGTQFGKSAEKVCCEQ